MVVVLIIIFSIGPNMERGIIMKYTLFLSLSTSGMLSGVQYIKRLYKACINDLIDTQNNNIRRIGFVMYFLFRPIFAMVFAVVAIIGILSGMFIVTGNLDYIINEKLMYLSTFVSCIIGYSIGEVMDRFKLFSKEKIEKI